MPEALALYDWFVAPPIGLPLSDHCLPLVLLDVSVTLPPAQNVVGPPAVTVGVAGIALTVTAVAAEGALSPLAEITPANASQLELAWSFSTSIDKGHEAAPIVVGATMYVVTPYPNHVIAFDLTKSGSEQRFT